MSIADQDPDTPHFKHWYRWRTATNGDLLYYKISNDEVVGRVTPSSTDDTWESRPAEGRSQVWLNARAAMRACEAAEQEAVEKQHGGRRY